MITLEMQTIPDLTATTIAHVTAVGPATTVTAVALAAIATVTLKHAKANYPQC